MRCVQCGENTRVTDSRDDQSTGKEWLVRRGEDVFGWWSHDFRLRLRQCPSCNRKETTIEVPLGDLEASYTDLRQRTVADELTKAGIRSISTEQLLSILDQHKTAGDALSHLLAKLFFQRGSPLSIPVE